MKKLRKDKPKPVLPRPKKLIPPGSIMKSRRDYNRREAKRLPE